MRVKPVLGDWLIPRVSSIKTLERRSSGGFQPGRIVITGSLYGDEARDGFLETVRVKYRKGEPVAFVADIMTATDIQYVTIETLVFQESGARPDQTDYLIALAESKSLFAESDSLNKMNAALIKEAEDFINGGCQLAMCKRGWSLMATFDAGIQYQTDIRLDAGHRGTFPAFRFAIEKRSIADRNIEVNDIGLTCGASNLEQAIMLRLMTPRGELASLGHPGYGSNLHELSGSVNSDTTRSLLRLRIIECLKMEPRVSEIRAVLIETDHAAANIVNVRLEVVPVGETGTLVIGPFALEFES